MSTDKPSKYVVEFFCDHKGSYPAKEYMECWPVEHQAKMAKVIALLQEYGSLLKRPYADILDQKVYELRPSIGGYQHRILYFFDGSSIVLTHGFLKKSDGVPQEQIKYSMRCMKEWFDAKRRAQ